MPNEKNNPERPQDGAQQGNTTLDDPRAAVPGYGRTAGDGARQEAPAQKDAAQEGEPIPLRNDETIGNP